MKKFFITGISGTGKTTIAKKLEDKGFKTIDIDYFSNLCSWVNKETGERAELSNTESPDNEFIDKNDYKCDTNKLVKMMEGSDEIVLVFGSVGDNSDLLHLFDKVILLQCKPETLVGRLKNRHTNDFGKKKEVQERILDWKVVFDDLMIKAGAIPIDTEESPEHVVENIIKEISIE